MKNKSSAAQDMNVANRKGIPSSDHWQIDVGSSVFPRGYGDDPAGAFLPRPGKDRAQPHKKINECDH
jgi:hypothetical protein